MEFEPTSCSYSSKLQHLAVGEAGGNMVSGMPGFLNAIFTCVSPGTGVQQCCRFAGPGDGATAVWQLYGPGLQSGPEVGLSCVVYVCLVLCMFVMCCVCFSCVVYVCHMLCMFFICCICLSCVVYVCHMLCMVVMLFPSYRACILSCTSVYDELSDLGPILFQPTFYFNHALDA